MADDDHLDAAQQADLRRFAYGDEAMGDEAATHPAMRQHQFAPPPPYPASEKLTGRDLDVAASFRACPVSAHSAIAALREVALDKHVLVALFCALAKQVRRECPRMEPYLGAASVLEQEVNRLLASVRDDVALDRRLANAGAALCERLPLSEKPCTSACHDWHRCESRRRP